MLQIAKFFSTAVALLLFQSVVTDSANADSSGASVVIGMSAENGERPSPGKLNVPFGVDFDAEGNMYIVELDGGRVHKLAGDGEFTTIAGDGTKGYSGDGGPAQQAVFNGMHNLAATPEGDLYIADSWNHCIRKIDGNTGIITTTAGTGEAGFSGDGGPAQQATFDFVMCVSLNPSHDRLFVADLRNRRIRMVDLESNVVTTVAGNGERGIPDDGAIATDSPLVDPRAVAVDSSGNVYILERGGHALRVVSSDGRIRTVAGNGERGAAIGPALQAQLNSPKHLAIDAEGNVIIADDANARICLYDPRRKTLMPILGAGVANPRRSLSHPHGVCVHQDGSLFVVDTYHHRVLRLLKYR